MAYFGQQVLIIISRYNEIFIILDSFNISYVINLAQNVGHKDSLVMEKPEKWDMIKFSDFGRNLLIFQFN